MLIPNASAGESRLLPAEERRIVEELEAAAVSNRKEGDLYYILSSKWWRNWQEYTCHESSKTDMSEINEHEGSSCRPGSIDNTDLILNGMQENDNGLVIDRNLMEGQDYVLVCHEAWKKFIDWYKGGPALPRKLLCIQGYRNNTWMVDVHMTSLRLFDARDESQRIVFLSRKASIGELYDKVCAMLKLERSKVCIFNYQNLIKGPPLSNFDLSVEDTLVMDQEILVVSKDDTRFFLDQGRTENALALVPFEPLRTSISIAGGPTISNGGSNVSELDSLHSNGLFAASRDLDYVNSRLSNGVKSDEKGLTGLHNLGNTCFMNSAIQCLVHTPPLVDYFLSDFSEEINEENPLGMSGRLALAFGDLLRKLWSSERTPISPRDFKGKLSLFAPQFSGYNQHDSQELLAFLLDGLHEDLNRVKRKPYIEVKDSDGRPDEVYAEECWEIHKARNDSIIVDICQGQYKSTLVCPNCSKVSVTFDPFMYLSLPLPSSVTRTMTITVIQCNGSALPMPFTVTVPKHGNCKDLTQALSTACCLKADEALLLAEVFEHRIFKYFENLYELLSSIKDSDLLVAYVLPKDHKKLLRVEIVHEDSSGCSSALQNICSKLVGTPLVTCLPMPSFTAKDILAAVEVMLKPLIRENAPSGMDEISNSNGFNSDSKDAPLEDDCQSCKMDVELEEDRTPSFDLYMVDVASKRIAFSDNSMLQNSLCSLFLLGWSKLHHNIYDFSYLDDLPVCKPGLSHKKTRQEAISLFSCLDAFLKEEPLGLEDMWYCPRCKEHRQATKKLDLWRLPEILVIHLKRFSYSRHMKNKLDTFVNFPVHNVDLGRYLNHSPAQEQRLVYELYAVSNHYGGLGGGHYTAYVKQIDSNSWHHFDDSHVSPVSEDSIKTSAAYVLFYRRVKAE